MPKYQAPRGPATTRRPEFSSSPWLILLVVGAASCAQPEGLEPDTSRNDAADEETLVGELGPLDGFWMEPPDVPAGDDTESPEDDGSATVGDGTANPDLPDPQPDVIDLEDAEGADIDEASEDVEVLEDAEAPGDIDDAGDVEDAQDAETDGTARAIDIVLPLDADITALEDTAALVDAAEPQDTGAEDTVAPPDTASDDTAADDTASDDTAGEDAAVEPLDTAEPGDTAALPDTALEDTQGAEDTVEPPDAADSDGLGMEPPDTAGSDDLGMEPPDTAGSEDAAVQPPDTAGFEDTAEPKDVDEPDTCLAVGELCDGIDNDCDGLVDEGSPDCTDGDPCTHDACLSGFGCVYTDLSCDDGLDCTADSCDGTCRHEVSPGRCLIGGACFEAGDRNPASACQGCVAGVPAAWSPLSTTTPCDDGNVCTHTDTCDGLASAACAGVAYTCAGACRECDGAGGCELLAGTCFDAPGCDPASPDCGTANDCRSELGMWYQDLDGDGYGATSVSAKGCTAPSGYVAAGGDCDDTPGLGALQAPGLPELCDGVDNDCSGSADEAPLAGTPCDAATDSDGCAEGHWTCDATGALACVADGPAAAFSFDRGLSGVTFADEADGTGSALVAGEVTLPLGASGSGRAVAWATPALDRYVRVDSSGFSGTSWSLALWHRPEGNATGTYVSMTGLSGSDALRLRVDGVTRVRGIARPGPVTTAMALTDGAWSHVAIAYDDSLASGNLRIYRNGTLVETATIPSGTLGWTSDLWLGQDQDSPNGGLSLADATAGAWDEVVWYDHALSSQDVAALATSKSLAAVSRNHELCDGVDNDCDGGTDETFPALGVACGTGVGSCALGGLGICDSDEALATRCSAPAGKPAGTSCSDGDDCTSGDACSGGDASACEGTPYSCPGGCRSCDGAGGCGVIASQCYLTAGCDPATPGCAGTCVGAGTDANGTPDSHDSSDASCGYCDPAKSVRSLTPRAGGWTCLSGGCTSYNTLSGSHACDGAGACVAPPLTYCQGDDPCTLGFCEEGVGCVYEHGTDVYDACYTGPPGTKDIGLCHGGIERCANGGPSGVCEGEVVPGMELCDGQDHDCDGLVDQGVPGPWFRDQDKDGWGDVATEIETCTPPFGYVPLGGDCVDVGKASNPEGYTAIVLPAAAVHPGVTEVCNDLDDDCDGQTDEGFAKGQACDTTGPLGDADTCLDGVTVCNPDGSGLLCANRMVWGTYGLSGDLPTEIDVSGFGNHAVRDSKRVVTPLPPLTVPVGPSFGGTKPYPSVGDFTTGKGLTVADEGVEAFDFGGTQFSVSAWVKRVPDRFGTIVEKGGVFSIYISDFNNFHCNLSGISETASIPITSTAWMHIGCTYRQADCRLETWVNGVLKRTVLMTNCPRLKTSDHPLRVGAQGTLGVFPGQIASVALYDVRLSDAEIYALAQKALPEGEANYEYCDGLDNDCDGSTDDLNSVGTTCTAGQGQCALEGTRVCDLDQLPHDPNLSFGRVDLCTVTGKPSTTVCDDGEACTSPDRCAGGDASACQGTTYTCSGDCRSCDGKGGCVLAPGFCFISETSTCNPATPSCTSGKCYASGASGDGVIDSDNAKSVSCKYCNPLAFNNKWVNRPAGWQCVEEDCFGGGMLYYPRSTCGATGTCNVAQSSYCQDYNHCTTDGCKLGTGCTHTPNTAQISCYTGEGGSGVGDCKLGTAQCSGGLAGPCVGDVVPQTEVCDTSPPNDEDCDGQTNEPGAQGCTKYYTDNDGDGYGIAPWQCLCAPSSTSPFYRAPVAGDCNDNNPAIRPGGVEVCNELDDDCDLVKDDACVPP